MNSSPAPDQAPTRSDRPLTSSAQKNQPARFVGWLADPGRPFSGPVLVSYSRRPLVLIGVNGAGKTRLLQAIVSRRTPRLYTRVGPLLTPYLAAERRRRERSTPHVDRGLEELFVEGESTRTSGDEHEWWATHLGRQNLFWALSLGADGEPASLSAVAATDPSVPLAVIPVAPRHAEDVIERWTVPEGDGPSALPRKTDDMFRIWAGHVLAACGGQYAVYPNPLIAGDGARNSISLLPLARAFADMLTARTSDRLRSLVGFNLSLQCIPEESFLWRVNMGDEWIPLEWMSRAMGRWTDLTAQETLGELTRVAEAATDDSVLEANAILRGELDEVLVPPGAPGPFASRDSWVALDEPEVHLFASEAHRLGHALVSHGGRAMIATHSLDLAAKFVGNADFLMFDAPGHFTEDRPTEGVATLLERLAKSGPGILAGTRVLYVEGHWDVEVIERLYGHLLSQHNILLSPMHGVKGASVAASSVWQRLMATPFGIMFDALRAEEAQAQWQELLDLIGAGRRRQALDIVRGAIRRIRNDPRPQPQEPINLLYMFQSVLDGGLEERLHLVMHGLSDIFQVLHPSVFQLRAPTWAAAGFDGKISFKDFLKRHSVDLTQGKQCWEALSRFDDDGRPVESKAEQALRQAIDRFAEQAKVM